MLKSRPYPPNASPLLAAGVPLDEIVGAYTLTAAANKRPRWWLIDLPQLRGTVASRWGINHEHDGRLGVSPPDGGMVEIQDRRTRAALAPI